MKKDKNGDFPNTVRKKCEKYAKSRPKTNKKSLKYDIIYRNVKEVLRWI